MRHDKLDLNLLVALDALLEECSVTRAADRVFLTQSAMSNALSRLRQHFQDELVTRVGRKMVRTQKSESIRSEVRAILLRISHVTRPVDTFDAATASRTFRIAASDYFSTVVLPGLMRHMEVHAPCVRFDVQPLSPKLNEELERGEIDLLIVPQDYAVKGFPSRLLFEDDWVCVAWSGNEKVSLNFTLDQFLEMEHVVKRQSHPSFTPIEARDAGLLGLERKIAVRLPQYGLLPVAVAGTQRIAVVQRRLATMYAAWLPLIVLECPFECTPLREMMQWHRLYEADTGHQWLREALAEHCDAKQVQKLATKAPSPVALAGSPRKS